MEARAQQLRSILKPSPSTSNQASPSAREVAIHHARLLEHRKELEAQILNSLILLSEFPHVRTPPYCSSNPAPSDVAAFRANVRLFQPSDYDDLIEERNVNGLCGYTLCARPKRETGPGGEWKLTRSGEIVKRKELEKWCSQQCARRALFVKVQLNETAAWERAGIPDIQIDILDAGNAAAEETEADRTARRLGELQLEDQRQAALDSAALATERGEYGMTQDFERMHITVKENEVMAPPENTSTILGDGQQDHLFVDGHRVRLPERRIS